MFFKHLQFSLSQVFEPMCTPAECTIASAYKCVNELMYYVGKDSQFPEWGMLGALAQKENPNAGGSSVSVSGAVSLAFDLDIDASLLGVDIDVDIDISFQFKWSITTIFPEREDAQKCWLVLYLVNDVDQ